MGQNVTLKTVNHGHRPRSLGDTDERGNRYFEEIAQQILDKSKNKQIKPVDRPESGALSMYI